MTWFAANWFWVLVFIAFMAMHMFGHGGHGGHSGHVGGDRQRSPNEGAPDDGPERLVKTRSGGQQH
ncbi:MAG: DUF2933 domain-containing protein [Gammaproteobacteria bacterium]